MREYWFMVAIKKQVIFVGLFVILSQHFEWFLECVVWEKSPSKVFDIVVIAKSAKKSEIAHVSSDWEAKTRILVQILVYENTADLGFATGHYTKVMNFFTTFYFKWHIVKD